MFTHVAFRSSRELVELCPYVPDRIGIWKCWFFWVRTNNKLNPHMMSTPVSEPGPHWWEASALTTTPTLRSFTCHRTGLGHQYGYRFIVRDTKMAEVTSCEIQSFRTGVIFKRKGLIVRLRASEVFFSCFPQAIKTCSMILNFIKYKKFPLPIHQTIIIKN